MKLKVLSFVTAIVLFIMYKFAESLNMDLSSWASVSFILLSTLIIVCVIVILYIAILIKINEVNEKELMNQRYINNGTTKY